jgi:hypothetical protein
MLRGAVAVSWPLGSLNLISTTCIVGTIGRESRMNAGEAFRNCPSRVWMNLTYGAQGRAIWRRCGFASSERPRLRELLGKLLLEIPT